MSTVAHDLNVFQRELALAEADRAGRTRICCICKEEFDTAEGGKIVYLGSWFKGLRKRYICETCLENMEDIEEGE